MGKRYLYGAAVQGIQNFIFQTNELKDIVGASELVELVCTTAFDEFGGSGDVLNSIVRAAGNIKYDFDNEEQCRKAVLEFPKKIQCMAPGITISQAVVEYNSDTDAFSDIIKRLESLLRIQRNCPSRSNIYGLTGIRRSRKTGLPAVVVQNHDYLDEPTYKKREKARNATYKVCEKAFGRDFVQQYHSKIPFNISEITKNNNWIAIIHADGNGFGKIFQKIGDNKEKLTVFSRKVDELTQEAARMAFNDIKSEFTEDINTTENYLPIRPVILNGDDLTVIIRGDLALSYTNAFLKNFETVTARELRLEFGSGLTACAGIAFIKSSYPFYYGYALAENLCNRAKNKAKKLNEDLAPSCLMFHKVHDSFIESYDDIVSRVLTPSAGLSFEFGPYFACEQTGYWTVDELLDVQSRLVGGEGNVIKSHLRKWIEFLYIPQKRDLNNEDKTVEKGIAEQYLKRFRSILQNNQLLVCDKLTKGRIEGGIKGSIKTFPVYDVLSIHSIHELKTK